MADYTKKVFRYNNRWNFDHAALIFHGPWWGNVKGLATVGSFCDYSSSSVSRGKSQLAKFTTTCILAKKWGGGSKMFCFY